MSYAWSFSFNSFCLFSDTVLHIFVFLVPICRNYYIDGKFVHQTSHQVHSSIIPLELKFLPLPPFPFYIVQEMKKKKQHRCQ